MSKKFNWIGMPWLNYFVGFSPSGLIGLTIVSGSWETSMMQVKQASIRFQNTQNIFNHKEIESEVGIAD